MLPPTIEALMQTANHTDKIPILAVEDDPHTLDLIAVYLEREGFFPLTADNGKDGLAMARTHRPHLVILDLMLPKMDGWEVCRQLRKTLDVPIIMLTARGEETDRVAGLTLGADDYVVKPFSPKELMARVRAVLRRSSPAGPPAGEQLAVDEIMLDIEKKQLVVRQQDVLLTPHEFTLLETLMARPGRVFSREELLDRLYPHGEAVVIDRVVDVHIGKLRQKIEPDSAKPKYILTVRGMGYKFLDKRGRAYS